MTWIVTGGAGYIGAHVVHLLRRRYDVVVYDDFSTGLPERLGDVRYVKGSLADRDQLDALVAEPGIAGVVHLAARKSAGESLHERAAYGLVNEDGTENVLAAMRRARVRRLVFASSAAVYGRAGSGVVPESRWRRPVNPYGHTKVFGERRIARERDLESVTFRMFNVVGAGGHPYAADTGVGSLLPAVFTALTDGPDLAVFGTDYATPDGSAVRDFVHVGDIAAAFVAGVGHLSRRTPGPAMHRAINLGSGIGTSVHDMIALVNEVTGREVPHRAVSRRRGDVAGIVADVSRARRLGLATRYSLPEAVASAWDSWCSYVAATPGKS